MGMGSSKSVCESRGFLKLRHAAECLSGKWRRYKAPEVSVAGTPESKDIALLFKKVDGYGSLGRRIESLLSGLDEESADCIKRLLKRIASLPLPELESSILLKRHGLYFEDELKDIELWKKTLPSVKSRYKLPSKVKHSPGVFMFKHGLPMLPKKALDYIKGKDFLDLGAYAGDSALALLEFEPRKIHSFDISSKSAKLYQETMKLNGVPEGKTSLTLAATGDREDSISFNDDGVGGTNLGTQGASTVKVITLDAFFSGKDINLGLLKVDIEGEGLAALRGARELLKRDRPVMALSIYHNAEELFDTKPFLEALGLGCKFKIAKLEPSHVFSDVTLLAYPAELEA